MQDDQNFLIPRQDRHQRLVPGGRPQGHSADAQGDEQAHPGPLRSGRRTRALHDRCEIREASRDAARSGAELERLVGGGRVELRTRVTPGVDGKPDRPSRMRDPGTR